MLFMVEIHDIIFIFHVAVHVSQWGETLFVEGIYGVPPPTFLCVSQLLR